MSANDVPPQLVLQQLIQGFQVTQGIYVAAKLGIADRLKDGPRTSEDLAQDTGTHAPSLYRVLRLLTAVGLLTKQEGDHAFALTPLGTNLQSVVPGSLRDTALLYGDKPFWRGWGDLLQRRNGRAVLSVCLRGLPLCLQSAASRACNPL